MRGAEETRAAKLPMLMTCRRLHRLTAAFLVALSFLLPLQVAWGAAAAYCEHETTQGAKHFGHHQHEHKADAHDAEAKKPVAKKLVVDNDCASCHISSSAIAADALAGLWPAGLAAGLVAATSDAHASAPTRAPDRPQWRRLA